MQGNATGKSELEWRGTQLGLGAVGSIPSDEKSEFMYSDGGTGSGSSAQKTYA